MSFKSKYLLLLSIPLFLISCTKKNKIGVCPPCSESSSNPSYATRIVTLSPAAAEIVCAVGAGDRLVAVSDFTDYPPQAAAKPTVGGFDGKTLSMESILSFKPDLVYLSDVMHNYMIPQFQEYGINYYISKAESVDAVFDEILAVGELTGCQEKSSALVAQLKQELTELSENLQPQTEQNSPSLIPVYWEVWNSPYMSAGGNSFVNDVIQNAGGKNIFDDLQEPYPIVSEEAIIKRNPKVILLPSSSGVIAETVKNRKGWETISAVQDNRIYIIDDNVFTRPGPRIVDQIIALNKILNQ